MNHLLIPCTAALAIALLAGTTVAHSTPDPADKLTTANDEIVERALKKCGNAFSEENVRLRTRLMVRTRRPPRYRLNLPVENLETMKTSLGYIALAMPLLFF